MQQNYFISQRINKLWKMAYFTMSIFAEFYRIYAYKQYEMLSCIFNIYLILIKVNLYYNV